MKTTIYYLADKTIAPDSANVLSIWPPRWSGYASIIQAKFQTLSSIIKDFEEWKGWGYNVKNIICLSSHSHQISGFQHNYYKIWEIWGVKGWGVKGRYVQFKV